MDPARLKFQFNTTKSLKVELKGELEELTEEWRTFPQNRLESIRQARCSFEQILRECEENLVNMYRLAIMEGIDVDDSRLLKVYQFIFRHGADLQHLLGCIRVPGGSDLIWDVVILTAIIYLWATV
ncbi:unnamed protein product [Caenorhabditis brenneri]